MKDHLFINRYALTHDGNRHHVERAASYLLIMWASIVTEK